MVGLVVVVRSVVVVVVGSVVASVFVLVLSFLTGRLGENELRPRGRW